MKFGHGFWVFASVCSLMLSGCFSAPLEPDWADADLGAISSEEDVDQGGIDTIESAPCDGIEFCSIEGESECSENPVQIKICSDVGSDCLEWQVEFCGADEVCVAGVCTLSDL